MLADLKRLTKNSGIYAVGQILSKAASFFLVPVYTRFLEPRDYAILELLDIVVFFATIFASLGVQAAFFRFHSAYDREGDRKEVLSTAQLFFALSSAGLALLLILLAPQIAGLVLGDASLGPLVRVVAFTLLFSNLSEVPMAYLRAQERAVAYVCVGVTRTVVGILALIVCLAVLRWGVVGALYANLFTNILFGLGLFVMVQRQTPFRIFPEKLKPMLRYSAPLMVQSLTSFVLVFSDRFFLRHFAGLNEVGIYALGYKLAGVVSFLVTLPFSMTWQWQQFELAKRENAPELYAKIQTYQAFVSLFFALAISVMARDVVAVLAPPSYAEAATIVPLIALSYVLVNARDVILTGIYVKGATQVLARIALAVMVFTLALNYVLIGQYRAMGAAVATVLSYAVSLGLTFAVVRRLYPVPYEYRRNALAFAAAVGIYFVGRMHDLPLLLSVAANSLLVCVFGAIALRLLDPDERSMFWKLGLSVTDTLRRAAARAE